MLGITKKRSWVRMLCGTVALGVLLGFVALVAVSTHIRREVQTTADRAQQHHPGDRVEALIACMEDPALGLKERNRVVWALGQLGDRRALPVLRQHHTGQPCDHAHALCQRELTKAIKLADGGINITAWGRGQRAEYAPPWTKPNPPENAQPGT